MQRDDDPGPGARHIDSKRLTRSIEAEKGQSRHHCREGERKIDDGIEDRLPANSSRTITQAMRTPARQLKTATPSAQTIVSLSAARDSG